MTAQDQLSLRSQLKKLPSAHKKCTVLPSRQPFCTNTWIDKHFGLEHQHIRKSHNQRNVQKVKDNDKWESSQEDRLLFSPSRPIHPTFDASPHAPHAINKRKGQKHRTKSLQPRKKSLLNISSIFLRRAFFNVRLQERNQQESWSIEKLE
jgi:hypothetical protein